MLLSPNSLVLVRDGAQSGQIENRHTVTVKIDNHLLPEIRQKPVHIDGGQAKCVGDRTVDIGRRSASGRLAQLLLELMEHTARRQLGPHEPFYFPWRQEHLADALGLTVVYVNRTMMNLRKSEIIDLDQKLLNIRDINALRRIADEG